MPAAFLAFAGVVLFGATVAVRQQANEHLLAPPAPSPAGSLPGGV
jgi:hypothetical protein